MEELLEAAVPTPVKAMDCGLPGASSVTRRDPTREPEAAGVKVTLITQLARAARPPKQSSVSEKSPVAATLTI